MAAGAIIAGISVSIELAKILIPLIQQWTSSGTANGTELTPAMIAELRALNDALTAQVVAELGDAAKP